MKEEMLLRSLKDTLDNLNKDLDKLHNMQQVYYLDEDDYKDWIIKMETNTNKIKYQNANEEETRVIKSIEDTRDIISDICEIIKKEGIK